MDSAGETGNDKASARAPIPDIDVRFDSAKERFWFVACTIVVGICTSFALGTMSGMGFDRLMHGDEIVRNPRTQQLILGVYAVAGIGGFVVLDRIGKRKNRRSVLKWAFTIMVGLWCFWSVGFGIFGMPAGHRAWHERAMFIFSGIAIGAVAASGTLTMMDRLGTIFAPAPTKRGGS